MSMTTLIAKVQNGRLLLDEPTSFPEGTELQLCLADEEDDLDDEEQSALNAALARSWEQAKAGKTRPAQEILDKLNARR